MSFCSRSFPALALSVVLLAGVMSASGDDSLAQHVPADVGLFVETRDAERLLVPLTDPQVWLTLAELAGQPAKIEEARTWRRRVRQTVMMDPADAIRTLFAQRVAFVGEGLGRSQDGLVICRPDPDARISDLLTQWNAWPMWEGRPELNVYKLRFQIGLAVRDELLIFGDAEPADGMFRRALGMWEPASQNRLALADDPDYRSLLARVPKDPDGVMFVRLGDSSAPERPATTAGSQPVSQPAAVTPPPASLADLPGPLRGSSQLLLALHRDGSLLHFSAVGDARPQKPSGKTSLYDPLSRLPERTLLAWGGRVDPAALLAVTESLPPRSALRIALGLHEATLRELLASLDPAFCVAIGMVDPQTRERPAPLVPAVALLLPAEDTERASQSFAALVDTSAALYRLLSLQEGLPLLPPVSEETISGRTVKVLDLSQLLRSIDGGAIAELQLCWTADDGVLIIASHTDWLRQILDARQGRAARLARVLRLTNRPVPPDSETLVVAQSGPLSDLGARWLDYLNRVAPQVLSEDWWRNRQPGGREVRLGINAVADSSGTALRIVRVEPHTPADGLLRAEDTILGIGGQPFATSQPAVEMQRGIAERPDARWVELDIRRGEAQRRLRVPVAFVDPVQALRRAVAIGRIAQRLVYFDECSESEGPRGFLTVELRTSSHPLFDLTPRDVPQLIGPDLPEE